ncbi:hypothetical protein [Sphingomonas sp. C3-2]|uniref:hypothetical protein n=1 Tax=Sphingomonas sp. C3-2 TaxID=3062169 RepID=UPI00294AB52A|nr:hypothetical protein [Sphingomonas sp. C3-2]WOK35954.1 hypothetical protein QYC26_13215 [Sphingomonas sp. C3-2]
MTEERITEKTDSQGRVVERTIVRTRRKGGGLAAILILLLIIVAGFFVFAMQREETRQTDAITGAAQGVEQGARDVGEAAQQAADDIRNTM